MVRILLIDPRNKTVTEKEVDGFTEMRDLVGGFIEDMPLKDQRLILYVNENGKWKFIDEKFCIPNPIGVDYVYGPAILMGKGQDGDETDVPITVEECLKLVNHFSLTKKKEQMNS